MRDWIESSFPSIIASQVSTILCFMIGSIINLPHIRNFFLQITINILVSFLMQLSVFPALIVLYTRTNTKVHKTFCQSKKWRILPILLIFCIWAYVIPNSRPLSKSFDMRKQLKSNSMTYRFLSKIDSFEQATNAPIYELTKGFNNDWQKIDEVTRTNKCLHYTPIVSWHSEIPITMSIQDWMKNPQIKLFYDKLINLQTESSVTVFASHYDLGLNATQSHIELKCLHTLDFDNTCYTSFERLGGYTVVELVNKFTFFAIISCIVSTTLGLIIARSRGVLTLISLAFSYLSTIGVISSVNISVNMMLVAVMLIAPGLIVDYTLHLAYNEDSSYAVFMSGVTSIFSAAPYIYNEIEGIRDFAIVYCTFLVLGMTHAFAFVYVSHIKFYETVPILNKEEYADQKQVDDVL
jgi:predicted RND superfamily exporter protein